MSLIESIVLWGCLVGIGLLIIIFNDALNRLHRLENALQDIKQVEERHITSLWHKLDKIEDRVVDLQHTLGHNRLYDDGP
jgi:hypothetical protein